MHSLLSLVHSDISNQANPWHNLSEGQKVKPIFKKGIVRKTFTELDILKYGNSHLFSSNEI